MEKKFRQRGAHNSLFLLLWSSDPLPSEAQVTKPSRPSYKVTRSPHQLDVPREQRFRGCTTAHDVKVEYNECAIVQPS